MFGIVAAIASLWGISQASKHFGKHPLNALRRAPSFIGRGKSVGSETAQEGGPLVAGEPEFELAIRPVGIGVSPTGMILPVEPGSVSGGGSGGGGGGGGGGTGGSSKGTSSTTTRPSTQ
jgi:hypothetical protein